MIYSPTASLLKKFNREPFLKAHQAILIGGTALAYHLKHRVSFDLDVCFPHVATLPELTFLTDYNVTGIEFEKFIQDSAINEGGNIEEYHKRFLVDDIKVDFMVNTSSNIYESEILKNDKGIDIGSLQIASLDTIFKLKALLLFDRNKIRDLYDMVYLLKYHNYTMFDFVATIQEYRITYRYEDILRYIEAKKEDPLDTDYIAEPKMDMCEYDVLRNFLVDKLKGMRQE